MVSFCFLPGASYTIYCLTILMLCNLLLQIDRFILAIVAKPVAQTLQFGDKVCMLNRTLYDNLTALDQKALNRSRETLDLECGTKNVRETQTSGFFRPANGTSRLF